MRRIKFLSMFVLLALLLSTVSIVIAQEQKPKAAKVHFVSATELGTAMREMRHYGLRVLAFQREYKIGDQTAVDGYFLTPEDWDQADTPTLEGRYWQSHGAMLQDLTQDINLERQDLDATAQAARQRCINDIIQAKVDFATIEGCWATSTCPTVYVVSMLVSGDAATLSEVASSNLVTRVDVQDGTEGNTRPSTDDARAPVTQALVSSYTWVPNKGDIYIHPHSYPGERYITNWMYWNDVSGFGSNSTYEHDFFLNDSDGKYGPGTYLTDDEILGGIPDVSYWATSLPRPYLDTRLFDPDYVKAYTVGCSDADAIAANLWYYTYVRARNGDASIDNGYLLAEIGHRDPSWCYESTWCVAGDLRDFIFRPYDIDPIPGDFYWTYP